MKTGHGGRSRTPERDDRKRSFRSPSPGGSHRHETRKTVNFKYPSAQTAEAESPSVAAQATQDDNDATDPDLRVTDSNTNTHDDDVARALQAWHNGQVMGSANIAMGHNTARPNSTVSLEDVSAWRRTNPTYSEWMSDSNIECVIEYNKTSKQDMISKKKEKRKANRTISNIEFSLKDKAMGAEPPQRRPFPKEVTARAQHNRKIKAKDASSPTSRPKRGIDDTTLEDGSNKRQHLGHGSSVEQPVPQVANVIHTNTDTSSPYDSATCTESPTTK